MRAVNEAVMLEVSDTARLIEALPYQLTNAQMKVWQEIKAKDLSGIHVMNRLIQGDVGSGKTILAFLALLMTAANGYQGAMIWHPRKSLQDSIMIHSKRWQSGIICLSDQFY